MTDWPGFAPIAGMLELLPLWPFPRRERRRRRRPAVGGPGSRLIPLEEASAEGDLLPRNRRSAVCVRRPDRRESPRQRSVRRIPTYVAECPPAAEDGIARAEAVEVMIPGHSDKNGDIDI